MLPLKALLRLYRAHPWLLLMSLAAFWQGSLALVAAAVDRFEQTLG